MIFKTNTATTSIYLDGKEFTVKDGLADIPTDKNLGTLERIHGMVPATAEEIESATSQDDDDKTQTRGGKNTAGGKDGKVSEDGGTK